MILVPQTKLVWLDRRDHGDVGIRSFTRYATKKGLKLGAWNGLKLVDDLKALDMKRLTVIKMRLVGKFKWVTGRWEII